MTSLSFLSIPEDNDVLAEKITLLAGQLNSGDYCLDNLVTLCRHHHRQLHRGSFTIAVEQSAAGPQLLFTTPSGSRIESSFFPLFQNVSAETPQEALRTMAPDVDAQTCVSKWCVEDCDYGMAIDALLEWDEAGRISEELQSN